MSDSHYNIVIVHCQIDMDVINLKEISLTFLLNIMSVNRISKFNDHFPFGYFYFIADITVTPSSVSIPLYTLANFTCVGTGDILYLVCILCIGLKLIIPTFTSYLENVFFIYLYNRIIATKTIIISNHPRVIDFITNLLANRMVIRTTFILLFII